MEVTVSASLARQFPPTKRFLTARYRRDLCEELMNCQSYRKACRSFNYHNGRTEDQEIPFSTFVYDLIQEGTALINAKRCAASRILDSFGFDPNTGLYPEKELPPHLRNGEDSASVIELNPDAILGELIENWNSSEPDLEEAYSEPDLEEKEQPSRPRRRNRTAASKDEIPSVCENYIRWRNAQNMHGMCRILHSWKLETDISQVVYIMIDAVYVPEQAARHVKGGKEIKEESGSRVTHWNVKVEWGSDSRFYIITDETLDMAFRELISFLLTNGLMNRYFVFFTDGESSIFKGINRYFGNWSHETYLDFPHLEKKCYELLSLAIIGKRLGDPRGKKEYYVRGSKAGQLKTQDKTSLSVLYARRVVSILWAGNVKEAIDYLNRINPEHIASQKDVNRLLHYLDTTNKGQYITCYALRRKAGLRNSSNGVEAVNNLIVANDQKSSNKTYRSNGSHASASIAAAFYNREFDGWVDKKQFTFEYITTGKTEQNKDAGQLKT